MTRTLNRKIVATWPAYRLEALPNDLRAKLNDEAEADDLSVQDIVRRLLCQRYRLHCWPESFHFRGPWGPGSHVLRLQPKLARALAAEAHDFARTKRAIILETLEAHYREEVI